MRVLVLGADGYLGWPTALHLSSIGWDVALLDNGIRRHWDWELGTDSLVPLASLSERVAAWKEVSKRELAMFIVDVTDYAQLRDSVRQFRPDAIVHFAEQRSAPYSMMDRAHAVSTQTNNIVGTLNVLFAIIEEAPDSHLVKLGSMGEYGTPNIDIEEGFLEVLHKGRHDVLPYPKQPGSFYHLSKVHDSHNIMFAARNYGVRATDLNQGIVYGVDTAETVVDPRLATRFDYDAVFGTALNRFCVQAAIGHPLTVYGTGEQRRGFINIQDTMRCIEIACTNAPQPGEYRVFNQFTEEFSINELAELVRGEWPGSVVEHLPNPRNEAGEHYYNAIHSKLEALGLVPHKLSAKVIREILGVAERLRYRVRRNTIRPLIEWSRGVQLDNNA